jgi:multiple sugar transport system permease protein
MLSRKKIYQLSDYILVYGSMLVFILPAMWIVLTAIRPEREVNASPPIWIPESITFSSFEKLFGGNTVAGSVAFMDYFKNTLSISLLSTVFALIVGTLAGYYFSRYASRRNYWIFLGIMLMRSIPGISLSLPLFLLFSKASLLDEVTGLVIAYSALNIPFAIWLMQSFFKDIPYELDEASFVDGCNRWTSFFRIALPLTLPGLAATGIFIFLISWGEFQISSVLARTVASKPFSVGLFDFTTQFTVDWKGMASMGVVMLIPAIVFVSLVQRMLIKGLTAGSSK